MTQQTRARGSKYKIVFLGDEGVGKTSIITRFVHKQFDDKYQATIGIDFASKTIYLEDYDRMVRLQVWDTAGQERFRSLIPSYIRDTSAAIIVYDVANKSSFDSIPEHIQAVKDIKGDDVVIMIIGNKIDLKKERKVTNTEGKELADKYNVMYHEVSAKTGENVGDMFKKIASKLEDCCREVLKQNDVEIVSLDEDDGNQNQGYSWCCGSYSSEPNESQTKVNQNNAQD